MSKNLANDTNVDALVNENIEESIPEEVVEDDASTEVVAEESVQAEETPQPEGPSPAMREIAKQWLPESIISSMRDDGQLQEFIAMAQNEGTAPQVEDVQDFELSLLPPDEFGDEDPVRKQLSALNDFYKGQMKQMKREMGDVVNVAMDIQNKVKSQEDMRHQENIRVFDSALDEAGHELVGKSSSMDSGQKSIRGALFDQASELMQKNNVSMREAVEQVKSKTLRSVGSKQDKQAYSKRVREQSNGRLGSGPSERLPEAHLPPEKRMAEFIQGLNSKRKK